MESKLTFVKGHQLLLLGLRRRCHGLSSWSGQVACGVKEGLECIGKYGDDDGEYEDDLLLLLLHQKQAPYLGQGNLSTIVPVLSLSS